METSKYGLLPLNVVLTGKPHSNPNSRKSSSAEIASASDIRHRSRRQGAPQRRSRRALRAVDAPTVNDLDGRARRPANVVGSRSRRICSTSTVPNIGSDCGRGKDAWRLSKQCPPRLLSRFEQDRSYFKRVAKVHCVTTNFLISVLPMERAILSPLWTPTPARTSHLSAGSIREILRTRMHRLSHRAEEPGIHRSILETDSIRIAPTCERRRTPHFLDERPAFCQR